jgi:4-amino-4-deoxy-L-arabinose transferase-like glycosyltransferase
MRRLVLPLVLLLAFVLRLIWLDSYPVGFTPDEASFGYDAYSILKTGKDQWGASWPLTLESFGDYKSALYSYLAIPSILLFGLTKFAVRFPNVLFGTGAVYMTYLLAGELGKLATFEDKKIKLIQYLSALLLAISPWHIMMSRGAFEANLTTFFLPLSVYLFLKGTKEARYLLWSAIFFGINLFTYHSAKLVTPLILLFLVIFFRKELKVISFQKLLPGILTLTFFLGLTFCTFLGGAGTRATDINISNGALAIAAKERISAGKMGVPDFTARIFHNKYQVIARKFVSNYLQYFSWQFLFVSGPAETTYGMIPGRGVLYWFEILFIPGVILILVNGDKRRGMVPLILWLVLAPIPAALTTGPGYAANRAVIILPALEIIMAFGAVYFLDILGPKIMKYLLLGFSVVAVIFFASFLEDYFIQSPGKLGSGMLSGNMEVAYWLAKNTASSNVVVSRKLSEPHIFIAFANHWDPISYQTNSQDWSYKKDGLGWVDMMPNYNLGNYLFRNIDWQIDKSRKNAYLVGKPEEFPESVTPLTTVAYPDGSPAFLIVQTTP